MKSKTTELLVSAAAPIQFPAHGYPEIAFVGRSNVGKSSLINTLLNRRSLARISGKPGKTQLINFYLINERLCFVDLPGYGYARVPKRMHQRWQELVYAYLSRRKNLVLCCLLLDCRRGIDALDLEVVELLERLERRTLLIATKSDKLSRSRLQHTLKQIRTALGLETTGSVLLPFSARTGLGKDELWRYISEMAEKQA